MNAFHLINDRPEPAGYVSVHLSPDWGRPSDAGSGDPDVDPVQHRIETLGFRTFSRQENLDQAHAVFQIINVALFALGLIALAVAAVGIANTMIMTVVERTREICILCSSWKLA